MKKLSFFLMAMLMSVMSFAETELFTQTYPGSPSSYTNAYTKSFTVTTGDYTLTYTNINNGQASNAWTEIRSGSKNGASVATIASEQIAAPIDKVVINFTQANAGSTNALYLEVSANSDFSSVTKIEADIAVGNVEFPIAAPAANQYYKITIDQAKGSANGFNRFNKVVFYQGEAAGEDVEIVAAPEFSVTEANFTTAFTLDITSEEGTTLKYTIDNTDPSTSATAIEVATNSTSVQITKSTAVKAIAIKGELKSVTKSKVYCYVNSAETAYTVAEAMEVIDAGLGLANELYVKGEISEIEKFDANYGSITYWIKDEEDNKFECYSGLGLNKAKFTSIDDLVVGSKVVVCGVMKKYNTIYEFNYNNYIVSLELPVAKFTVTATAENGTVEGAGEYEEGAEATLTATAAEGYEFVNWTSGETEVSTANPFTFTVTSDTTLVANFKEVVVEPTEVTVYCINSAKWDVVACHHWVDGGSGTSWPGDVMTKTEETVNGFDVYAATFTIEHTSCIFNNNNNGSQTGNLTVENGHYYYVKDAKWYASLADVPALDPLATNVYLAGEMNGWSTVANEFRKATEDATTASLTLTLEAATTYQFKVVKEGAWLGNNGTITASVEGWTFTTGTNNCKLTTDAAGEYVLTWDLNTDKLTVTYPELEPEIEWIEMPLEISNLTTMEMPVEGVTYLQLTGRNDQEDAEVMLFLNNYTGEEKAYEVNAESSYMTFGGSELTVIDGSITKSVDPELGDVYAGIVHASVGEDGETMYVAFDLKMYALPSIAIELEDVEIVVNEESAIAFFNATWEGSPLQVEVSGFEEVEFKEYPECWLSIGDSVNWVDAAAGPAAVIIEDGVAMLEGEFTSFSTGKTYEVMLTGTLPVKEEPALKGVVKRALTIGESTVVLTHEADGTPHIYNIVGEEIAEISLEGVVPVDPENKGSYLAISDIAATEDGKLIANNYVRCQFGTSTAPGDGYKRGTSYYYIWNDLAGAPAVWFTSQTTARSSHGDVGRTFAVKGTSTNAKVLVTAVHNNNRAVRMSLHSIIDGVYEDPNIDGGIYDSEYYMNFGLHTTANYYKEATQGKEFYLLASPLADASWIIEGELSEPSEFLVPAEVGADYAANQEIAAGTLGNKYQGTTIVTVGEQHLMVAPYADAEGKLAGVKVLDITAGLDAATEVATADLDAAVEATAAATAVAVAENALTITLVADATIYTLNVELPQGPGTALENIAVEGKAVKAIVNGQLLIIKNGVQYNAQGAVVK